MNVTYEQIVEARQRIVETRDRKHIEQLHEAMNRQGIEYRVHEYGD